MIIERDEEQKGGRSFQRYARQERRREKKRPEKKEARERDMSERGGLLSTAFIEARGR